MKKKALGLMVVFYFFLGSVNVVYAGGGVSKAWEDVKRESTKATHNTGKTIGKAWEDIKRESTNAAHDQNVQAAVGLIGGAVGPVKIKF
ncbi:MAG: hypothetical protein LBI80_04445 [Endomicrobium sp.]|jgi:hypothetical protein|nr:hypothetical protein [Endomicrobium sp.]